MIGILIIFLIDENSIFFFLNVIFQKVDIVMKFLHVSIAKVKVHR